MAALKPAGSGTAGRDVSRTQAQSHTAGRLEPPAACRNTRRRRRLGRRRSLHRAPLEGRCKLLQLGRRHQPRRGAPSRHGAGRPWAAPWAACCTCCRFQERRCTGRTPVQHQPEPLPPHAMQARHAAPRAQSRCQAHLGRMPKWQKRRRQAPGAPKSHAGLGRPAGGRQRSHAPSIGAASLPPPHPVFSHSLLLPRATRCAHLGHSSFLPLSCTHRGVSSRTPREKQAECRPAAAWPAAAA